MEGGMPPSSRCSGQWELSLHTDRVYDPGSTIAVILDAATTTGSVRSVSLEGLCAQFVIKRVACSETEQEILYSVTTLRFGGNQTITNCDGESASLLNFWSGVDVDVLSMVSARIATQDALHAQAVQRGANAGRLYTPLPPVKFLAAEVARLRSSSGVSKDPVVSTGGARVSTASRAMVQLLRVARALFHFARSPLCSHLPLLPPLLVQHRAALQLRCGIARASLVTAVMRECAVSFVGGAATSKGSMPKLQLGPCIPLQSLALDSELHAALLHDDGDVLTLWLSARIVAVPLLLAAFTAAVREHAAQGKREGRGSERRIVMTIHAGSSDERWLRCRLAPGHHDAFDVQCAAFPALERITALRRAAAAGGARTYSSNKSVSTIHTVPTLSACRLRFSLSFFNSYLRLTFVHHLVQRWLMMR